ncbi:sugar phosphate isomerase/epimerase family protein [Haliea sp. E17]|uniref:sugar phosphate isomerase/epimerase family protein n=1 Tax=Haliea sp. E17 TaxID=3401576 RepID=UPI003AACE5E6
MPRSLILHQLNAPDVGPVGLIELAARNDCGLVTLFAFDGGTVLPRSNSGLTYPTAVSAETRGEVTAALASNGVAVDGVEFFPLTAEVDLERYVPALALGAAIGARRAVTHVFIDDDALVVDKLGRFCDLAAREGLVVSAEFCPLTPGLPSLQRGVWLVDQVGRGSFGLGFDTLHIVRSGATAEQIAALDPRYFGIVQVSDSRGSQASNDYIADVHHREPPGHGELPLASILNAVPAAMPIEAEVPAAHRRAAGVSAAEHVRDVLEGARAVIATLEPLR